MEGDRRQQIRGLDQGQAQGLMEPGVHHRQHVLPAAVFEALDGLAGRAFFIIEDGGPGLAKRGRVGLAGAAKVVLPLPDRKNPAAARAQGACHALEFGLAGRAHRGRRLLLRHFAAEDAEAGQKEIQQG